MQNTRKYQSLQLLVKYNHTTHNHTQIQTIALNYKTNFNL